MRAERRRALQSRKAQQKQEKNIEGRVMHSLLEGETGRYVEAAPDSSVMGKWLRHTRRTRKPIF